MKRLIFNGLFGALLGSYVVLVVTLYQTKQELVALKARYAKMDCVEVFDYPFENKQSGKK